MLILSYTQTNQQELVNRIARRGPHACTIDVHGWFTFLMAHWIRPYLPRRFAQRRLRGLNFEGDPGQYATGEARFLDEEQRAYRRHLARFAFDVNAAADGAPLDRLSHLYDVIYIDEVQDLNGWDLEIVGTLMDCPIELYLVGDIRQAILFTNVQDPKNSQYKGTKVIDWFRRQEKASRLEIRHENTTWRSAQVVADLADSVIDEAWGFPPTESKAVNIAEHAGIFAVAVADAERYMEVYEPLCLRSRVTSGNVVGLPYTNIGNAKGMEADHVLIWPTQPMIDFLRKRTPLTTLSACAFYVAITRARASVAFITDQATGLTVWTPRR
jgi:superfamily I DNA/RNA helicase